MPTERILVSTEGHVARLTINQPERRNSMTYEMWQALDDAAEQLQADEQVRVIVFTGAGDKAFCAGNDISEFEHWHATPQLHAQYDAQSTRAVQALRALEKPLIARVRGVCVGGGFELAQLCDFQIASDDARFAVTPAKLGIGYKLHDMQLLTDRINARYVRELLFTGRFFDAQDAARMGFVNRVVPADELDDVVDSYAADIAANAPLTVTASKVVIREALKAPAERDEARCEAVVSAANQSEDAKEGSRAFGEKRKPAFVGR